ncbi:MAG: MerR family transcriptional regulator [Ruthenibacterium sp.]
MNLKINEVAKRTGITVRTLHYYDEINLLAPSKVSDAGYRMYDEDALCVLQQILFFKELDFSLSDIKAIITNPQYDKTEALKKQKILLLQQKKRLDRLLTLVDDTIKGESNMNFDAFDKSEMEACKEKYAAEVKERWGGTDAYKESEAKTNNYDAKQWKMLDDEGAALLKSFGEQRMNAPDSEAAQKLVAQWQAYITANFYHCTDEILGCLGQMYVGDVRFTENIDKNKNGTAAFMAKAIAVYCAHQHK